MSRNRFEDILRYFHVGYNANLDPTDKFSKVRPLWNMLNERWFQAYYGDVNLSIDESMVRFLTTESTVPSNISMEKRSGLVIRCGVCVHALVI